MGTPADRPVVIASNRGPVAHSIVDGVAVGRRGSGGLVTGLAPLVEAGRATWIAAALTEGDRLAVATGMTGADGLSVDLLALDPEDHRLAYDVVSNETLWFAHHGLFDLTRTPAYDEQWWSAWDAYRRVNAAFADAVYERAAADSVVLVQDYHLCLLAPEVRRRRPDLTLVHFHHTPFAGPDTLRALPTVARTELLRGLAAHHACGFHTPGWAANLRASWEHWGIGHDTTRLFDASLSSDAASLLDTMASPECRTAGDQLAEQIGDRRLVVRVDRMELSKNIVRGFRAFDLLLDRRADLRGAVSFLACCYPSREGVEAYRTYRDEVEAAAAAVNRRWGTEDWTPVHLLTDDDFPRSLAALVRYDVLVVNPIRDGLNLVAKEGPIVNRNDGQVVLSTQAGAFHELHDAVDAVDPFDLVDTAEAIAAALDRSPEDRARRAVRVRELSLSRTPADWLADQLRAAG